MIVTIEGCTGYDPWQDMDEVDVNRPVWLLADKPVNVTITKRADGRLEIYIHNGN